MWTAKNRRRYDRSALRYPSDLTDDEWAFVEPLIPPARRGGNRRSRAFIVCDCAATNLMKQNRSEPLYPAAFLKMLSRMCTSLHVASSDCQSSGGFPFFSIAAKTA